MMLSENIKNYRKANNMSQEELAQKLNVSRQSVSLWENGQAQPTIDNIIALTKIFGVSSDELLGNSADTKEVGAAEERAVDTNIGGKNSGSKKPMVIGVIAAVVVALVVVLIVVLSSAKNRKDEGMEEISAQSTSAQSADQTQKNEKSAEVSADTAAASAPQKQESGKSTETANADDADTDTDTDADVTVTVSVPQKQENGETAEITADTTNTANTVDTAAAVNAPQIQENEKSSETDAAASTSQKQENEKAAETDADTTVAAANTGTGTQQKQENEKQAETVTKTETAAQNDTQPQTVEVFDLFSYCKTFAIEKGDLNGDYCFYQQPSVLYGGYDNEYFSISYWGDSDMVEFCLHCPLDDTYSINFYLRMRGGYYGEYEYLTSKYYRSDGYSIRSASGYIDPSVFSDRYPLPCDSYDGNADGQDGFMEESRVGMCDLIKCLKQFVTVENMECSFSDFGFVNF